MNDVTTAKALLREVMKSRRAMLPAAGRQEKARALAERGLMALGLAPPAVVSAFNSFGEELDTGPLLRRLAGEGYTLGLPVMQGKTRPLLFRRWAPGDPMRRVQWGIEEPLETAPLVAPDVLLVPLLAIDRRGYRLGYGGGYYDRTLRELRGARTIIAVGLGFDEQVVDAVPYLDYDERLDWILTPSQAIRCQS